MLRPDDRTVRQKLQLFLRLWVARQKYEQLRPFGDTCADRTRFHLEQLRACWEHVIEAQRALGLEVMHFHPTEKFEMIYVVTAFVEREVLHSSNTILELPQRWHAYQQALRKLSYHLNPYDFSDACSRCHNIVRDIILPPPPDPLAGIIPLPQQEVAHIHGLPPNYLKMKSVPEDQSDSGLSRYSPGGRFSYSRK